jgi:HSP20 family molecular chaperone IbpA
MTFRKWDPLQDLLLLHHELYVEGPEEGSEEVRSGWAPALDIFETGEGFVLRAEVAGLDPERIRV